MGSGVECVCYIIKSTSGTYYTGITINLLNRWLQHNQGKSSYFSHYKPLLVVYVEFFDCKKLAARKEKKIKSIGAKKYLLKELHRLQVR